MKPLHKNDAGKRGNEGEDETGYGSSTYPPSNHLPNGNIEGEQGTVASPHIDYDLLRASTSSGGSRSQVPAHARIAVEPYRPIPPPTGMQTSPRVNRFPGMRMNSAVPGHSDRYRHMGTVSHVGSSVPTVPSPPNASPSNRSPQMMQPPRNYTSADNGMSPVPSQQDNLHYDGARDTRRDWRHMERVNRNASAQSLSSSYDSLSTSLRDPATSSSNNFPSPVEGINLATHEGGPGTSYLLVEHELSAGPQMGMPSPTFMPDELQMTTAMAAPMGGGSEIALAKKHVEALERSVHEIDVEAIREMVNLCQVDQEKLQLLLSNALEESAAIDNLEEHFAVNDRLCSAIENGKTALERSKPQLERRRSTEDGPTIELLVDNEDVFSLICMLRASNEKKVLAAFALMKFARENEMLRNEIRSSGGMHSFLSLFRSKGSNDVLRIVASMAVAYILPSFVVSSQTSASIGLKIMECLRCLTGSNPIGSKWNGDGISRTEMLEAASMGVNVLWANAVHPLLLSEAMKGQTKATEPSLRPTMSLRVGRSQGRTDQSHETHEIWELAESAIILIAHLSKISNLSPRHPLDVGYNIVEQVCEIEWARPIAVREGLLATLVEWTRSKDVDKVRPAISALRYLVSVNDQYMAGWIHSQVVNEGCVGEIVKRLNESVGHDTRVAVAQMLSALCVAPHTRAAVVEARCVGYLVALLYEHGTSESEGMVQFAASALLQLADGAMVRASGLSSNGLALESALNRHDTVIT
jgi:hypothetical protein